MQFLSTSFKLQSKATLETYTCRVYENKAGNIKVRVWVKNLGCMDLLLSDAIDSFFDSAFLAEFSPKNTDLIDSLMKLALLPRKAKKIALLPILRILFISAFLCHALIHNMNLKPDINKNMMIVFLTVPLTILLTMAYEIVTNKKPYYF